MKYLTVGDDSYLVSDVVAHHVRSYHRLLSALGRGSEVMIPVRISAAEQGVVTLSLSRDTLRPIVTDYDGGLVQPDDPDTLADLIEQEALTMVHDLGELNEEISADWQQYTELPRSG